jgi:hypothetical protein
MDSYENFFPLSQTNLHEKNFANSILQIFAIGAHALQARVKFYSPISFFLLFLQNWICIPTINTKFAAESKK